MSFSAEQSRSFLGPLKGKTTTFLLDGRNANLSFAHVALSMLARAGESCTIFDLDALYSSNSGQILGPLPITSTRSTTIFVPEPGSSIEREFSRIFATDSAVIIIDSLNTFHHLLSSEDGGSRSRKLSFAVASLSYIANTGRKAVIFTMYRREAFGRVGAGRSMSSLSEVTASVEFRGSELSIVCERGTAWPGGRFSVRIP